MHVQARVSENNDENNRTNMIPTSRNPEPNIESESNITHHLHNQPMIMQSIRAIIKSLLGGLRGFTPF